MEKPALAQQTGIGYYQSPVGDLVITSEDDGITSVLFSPESRQEERLTSVIEQCILELEEYFLKGRKFFTVELKPRGTQFQQKVWNELLTIPFGKTISYEALAIRIGDINAIRAVGLANGQNPISIIVPCHRVIGKNGDLTGYAGGIENKEWLLYHEGSILRQLNLF
jgi:methylated-DNA-[protein]-cysteine S-methyltransferase